MMKRSRQPSNVTTPRSRPLPTLISRESGFAIICLIIAGILIALIQIAPYDQTDTKQEARLKTLPLPELASTEALSAWHDNPLDGQGIESQDAREQLTEAWNTFRGKFSPLPNFDELPATFRMRTLAAGYGENGQFTIAMHSEWDPDTISEKLRPIRDQAKALATYRVDIDRLENGVLVETHELNDSDNIYVLRHASWLIVTNVESNIPVLAKAAVEQAPAESQEISPQTYAVIQQIVEGYTADQPEPDPTPGD